MSLFVSGFPGAVLYEILTQLLGWHDNFQTGESYTSNSDLIVTSVVFLGLLTLPWWAVIKRFSDYGKQKSWFWFANFGALFYLLLLLCFFVALRVNNFSDSNFFLIAIGVPMLISGFLSGLVYWAIAGRYAGVLRDPSKPVQQFNRALIGHLIISAFAYCLAISIASAILQATYELLIVPKFMVHPEAFEFAWHRFFHAIASDATAHATGALPFTSMIVFVAEDKSVTKWYYFVLLGWLLTFLLPVFAQDRMPTLMGYGLWVGGATGGLVYWAIAGRYSGSWKSIQ
jgi:hypothetical protein